MDPEHHAAGHGKHRGQSRQLPNSAPQLVQIALAGHGAVPGPGQEFHLGRHEMDGGSAGTQVLCPAPNRFKAAHAKAPGQGGAVQQPNAAVHGENGPAHPVRIGAEVAQQHSQHAAAHPEQGLTHRCDRCGSVIGGHEHRPQHQTAAAQLGSHPGQRPPISPGEEQGQQGDGPQIGQGDAGGDHAPPHQVHPAQQKHEHRRSAHCASVLPQHQLAQGQVGQRSGVEQGHRGRGGDRVHRSKQRSFLERVHPGGHQAGKGTQQRAPRQGGVHKVPPQSAVKLLDHHNGKDAAQHRGPVGRGHRKAHGQQQAGDAGGQVAHCIAQPHQPAVAVLRPHAGCHGHQGQGQHPGAEQIDRHAQGGQQGHDHIQHRGGDAGHLGDLRG